MQALLLAAGVGKRLGEHSDGKPKCLLQVSGQTLLERHLQHYVALGFAEAVIVVGHEAQSIKAHVDTLSITIPIRYVMNEQYTQGSILSLHKGLEEVIGDVIFMDADVYYPQELLGVLLHSEYDSCVLIDPRSEESGEEMMIGIRNRRAAAIARRISPLGAFDETGESIGFFKVSATSLPALRDAVSRTIQTGGNDQEYEAALGPFFDTVHVGYERVGDMPWTEIDFEQDLQRARDEIAPHIKPVRGSA